MVLRLLGFAFLLTVYSYNGAPTAMTDAFTNQTIYNGVHQLPGFITAKTPMQTGLFPLSESTQHQNGQAK